MSVSGVGGSASLPMTLPSSTAVTTTTTTTTSTGSTTTSTAATTGSTGASENGGELRLPGQHTRPPERTGRTEQKEAPKPAPLPPLKGLTVAEIRAMLGVAPLPGQVEAGAIGITSTLATAAATAAPSVSAAFLHRYV